MEGIVAEVYEWRHWHDLVIQARQGITTAVDRPRYLQKPYPDEFFAHRGCLTVPPQAPEITWQQELEAWHVEAEAFGLALKTNGYNVYHEPFLKQLLPLPPRSGLRYFAVQIGDRVIRHEFRAMFVLSGVPESRFHGTVTSLSCDGGSEVAVLMDSGCQTGCARSGLHCGKRGNFHLIYEQGAQDITDAIRQAPCTYAVRGPLAGVGIAYLAALDESASAGPSLAPASQISLDASIPDLIVGGASMPDLVERPTSRGRMSGRSRQRRARRQSMPRTPSSLDYDTC